MWDVGCGMLNVKCFLRMRNGEWPCGMLGVSHRSRGATQMPFGVLYQKTRISPMRTDRSFHGFFTLAPRPTAWFLMRRRRNGWARILSQAGREMHLCKSERSVGDN